MQRERLRPIDKVRHWFSKEHRQARRRGAPQTKEAPATSATLEAQATSATSEEQATVATLEAQATSAILSSLLSNETCCVPWPHVRLMVRGTGGAGKTTTIDSIAGKKMQPSRSTVGANILDFELSLRDFHLIDSETPLPPHVPETDQNRAALVAYAVSQARDPGMRRHRPSMLDTVRTTLSAGQTSDEPCAPIAGASHLESTAPNQTTPHSLTLSSSPRTESKGARLEVPRPSPELVEKYISGEMQQRLVFRVQDTGGQPVFMPLLDMLTVPDSSVFLVVFSLVKMEEQPEECVEEVAHQIQSIHLFAPGGPIILVGTRKDQMRHGDEMLRMSGQLWTHLHRRCGPAVSNIITCGASEGTDLCFFGIENERGFWHDATIQELVRGIGTASEALPSVKERVPLSRLRVYDELRLVAASDSCVQLGTALEIAERCGMPHRGFVMEEELPAKLRYFHSLNALLWWDTPELRELVLLDAQWIIDACCCFIRNFQHSDHTVDNDRMASIDQMAMRTEPEAWDALTKGRATLNRKLVNVLWQQPRFAQHKELLLDIMRKFRMVVPVRGRTDEYLLPVLLPELTHPLQPFGWPPLAPDAAQLRLHFTTQERRCKQLMYHSHDRPRGFLPIGIFHELTAGALASSGMLPGEVQPLLFRNRAFVSFGRELAMLSCAPDVSCVTVQLTSSGLQGGAEVIDRLRVLLAEELALYSEVHCGILVPVPGSQTTWVDIDVLPLEEEDATTRALWGRLTHWHTASCEFAFLRADSLRASTADTFPRMHTLQELESSSEYRHWVVRRRVSLEGACRRDHEKEFLAVSHRWETSDVCDPTGEQLERPREHLRQHPEILNVFVDFMCLYQGHGRTPEQKAQFQLQLPNINLLYLGASVLILFDYDFAGHFWTQFEAWLSLQRASTSGLTSATTDRTVITCIHGTQEVFGRALRELWADCTAHQAHINLSANSVRVTNSSDKKIQLPKIAVLDRTVSHLLSSRARRQGSRRGHRR